MPRFLRKRGDDPAVGRRVGLGWINQTIGRPVDALVPWWGRAEALHVQLVREYPGGAEFRGLAAFAHGAMALLLPPVGRHHEAVRAHRLSLELGEVLAEAESGKVIARNEVACTRRNIGDVRRQVGKVDEALGE